MTATNAPEAQPQGGELLPCPLCGSTDLFLRDIAGWELDCRGCELSLVLADDPSREGLIERWNTRADLPRATAGDNEEAQEIVGRWGYEEPYWWEPIAAALARREAKVRAECTPHATGETTVEAALAELRGLVGDKTTVNIGVVIRVGFSTFAGSTLDEAVAQVRAAAQTKAERGEK